MIKKKLVALLVLIFLSGFQTGFLSFYKIKVLYYSHEILI